MGGRLVEVMQIYQGSDGGATRGLYERLAGRGPRGRVAMNLIRAQKNSERAKLYRGGNREGTFRSQAYERKAWAIGQLAAELAQHATALGLEWGWGEDPAQDFHRWVLYVELPGHGQVSFHMHARGVGPDHARAWDGQRGLSPQRVCAFAAAVLEHLEKFTAAPRERVVLDPEGAMQTQQPDGSLRISWLGREGDA